MTARTSKETTALLASFRHLLSAMTTQGPAVAAIALSLTRPHLQEGDQEPDFQSTLNALIRQLQAASKNLVAIDEKLYAANAFHAWLRQRLSVNVQRVGDLLVALRRSALGQYREPDLVRLGLENRSAQDSERIVRQGLRAGETLQRDDVLEALGSPLFPAPTFDPSVCGKHLGEVAAAAQALYTETDEQKRLADEALLEKDALLADGQQLVLRSARVFEDLCRLAGKPELADRVRPSVTGSPTPEPETSPDAEDGEDGEGDVPAPVPDVPATAAFDPSADVEEASTSEEP